MMKLDTPIKRPTIEEARAIFLLTAEDRRRLKPGLPVRRFVHPIHRTMVATRDHDIYAAAGWIELTRRPAL
jgi:hypothetical protein